MRNSKFRETDGLGDPTIPNGYGTPGFDLGTATSAGPNPDQRLVAQTAAITPNGIDPLNSGFSVGGAQDPLAELEKAQDNPPNMDIGGGKPTPPYNSPSHPAMSSMKEDEPPFNEDDSPFTEQNPFAEQDPFIEDDPFVEDDLLGEDEISVAVENVDALPTFEDISMDPEIAALPVDASGVIEPIVIPDEVIVEPELGAIPDVVLPLEEPIVEIDSEDVDVQIPENVFENDGIPEPIPVTESFKLPENQRIIVSKGDQIFLLGQVREEFTPKFAESVFTRALKSLCEGKGVGKIAVIGNKQEKVAIVGRSVLVEVAKDWRLPGTNTIFEAHDLLQIVSAKPIREGDEEDDPKSESEPKKKENDAKSKEEADEEKLKKEAAMAFRRWKEAEQKRKEKDGDKDEDEDDKDEDDKDKDEDEETKESKKKKERAKREAAFLHRQRTGGYI